MNDLLFLSLNKFIECKKGDKGDKGFIFPSTYKIEKLKDNLPLSYNDCHFLIYYLNLQQNFLEEKGYGFFLLDINNVIVIKNSNSNSNSDSNSDSGSLLFAYTNSEHIKKISKSNKINNNLEINFMTPFSIENTFSSPEILEIKSIPCSVSYKCFYYSLGALSIHCLFYEELEDSNFELLKGTKLYWLIKRIMHIDPEKRTLFLI
jgi:hypothetical protein